MHVFTRKMRDATGKVRTYRTNAGTPSPATGHPEPPEHPHPDEVLKARWTGYFIPAMGGGSVVETAAYYAAHPESEGHPVSGDDTARTLRSQCGDRARTGECRGPDFCQAAPHEGNGWISDRVPRYRDIARSLYPAGTAPVPAEDAARPTGPVQLDLFDALEELS